MRALARLAARPITPAPTTTKPPATTTTAPPTTTTLAPAAPPARAGSEGQTERLGDHPDVVLAAIALSQRVFDDLEAGYALVGRDDAFPDNLAGTALAGDRAPILYTTGGADARLGARQAGERVSGG